MGSACLIAAVTLFFIIARGQARPLDDHPAFQNGLHTDETSRTDVTIPPVELELQQPAAQMVADNLKPETSKASMENEQTAPPEVFTGEHHTPIKKEEETSIGKTISEDKVPSNESVSARKPEDMPEEKTENKPETSKASTDNEKALHSEAFSGEDSESKEIPHTPIKKEEETTIDKTITEDKVPSNESVSARKPEDVPEEKTENKSETSSETFSGEDSENKEIPHTPIKKEEETTIDKTISDDKVPSNESVSARKLEVVPEEKTENKSETSSEAFSGEDSESKEIPHTPIKKEEETTIDKTIPEDKVPSNESVSARKQEDVPEEKTENKSESSKSSEIHRNNVTKSVSDTATRKDIPATTQANATIQAASIALRGGHISHTKNLTTMERPDLIQLSNGTDISEKVGQHSPHEEEAPSKDIEIEAEGAEGRSSKGEKASSSDWLFTAVTVAVAMDGIVKAFSSSSPSFKDATSLPEGQLSVSSFVDPSISKSTSSSASLLPPVPPSQTKLPGSSFEDTSLEVSPTSTSKEISASSSVDTRITKNSSLSQVTANVSDSSFVDNKAAKDSPPSITSSEASIEPPVSSVADTRILEKPLSLTSSLGSSQNSTEASDPFLVDTRISKDSSSSMTSSSASSRESAEKPGSPFEGSSILNDTSSSSKVSTSTLIETPKLPVSSSEDAGMPSLALPSFQESSKILNDTSFLSNVSTSNLTQAPELPVSSFVDARASMPSSAQLPASCIEDIKISKDLIPEKSVELPISSIADTRILKEPSSPSSPLTVLPALPAETKLSQPLKEVSISSLAEAKVLNIFPPSPTLSLTKTPKEVAVSSLEDAGISKDSPSSLPLSPLAPPDAPKEMPLSSFAIGPNSNAAEHVLLNSFKNGPLVTSFEKNPAMPEEKRDAADVKLTDMGDDMDVAETMVFRPVFSYRQDSARRRLFRSIGDQRNYL